jgi:hypothetical protein
VCDYSLMEFPNRLAVEGEVLVAHRFRSGSLGLASPADCSPKPSQKKPLWRALKDFFGLPEAQRVVPAVCIPPGAHLILHDLPTHIQKDLAVKSDEEVEFVQISAAVNQYRDAVCFRNCRILRLQDLEEGQRVEVADLGNATEEPTLSDAWDMAPVSLRRA